LLVDLESGYPVARIKSSTTGDALCEGVLPGEFAAYINYTRSLGFDDKPDYSRLRGAFCRRFRAEGFKYDNVFDWTVKRFNEIQSENSSS
jgi:casein kinase 1 delta/casein kinase I family protein HRR25